MLIHYAWQFFTYDQAEKRGFKSGTLRIHVQLHFEVITRFSVEENPHEDGVQICEAIQWCTSSSQPHWAELSCSERRLVSSSGAYMLITAVRIGHPLLNIDLPLPHYAFIEQ